MNFGEGSDFVIEVSTTCRKRKGGEQMPSPSSAGCLGGNRSGDLDTTEGSSGGKTRGGRKTVENWRLDTDNLRLEFRCPERHLLIASKFCKKYSSLDYAVCCAVL